MTRLSRRRRYAVRTALRAQRVVVGGRGAEQGRLEHLERLARLHDTGALTDDEYAAEKTVVLANGAAT
jgi:hypothetical protein